MMEVFYATTAIIALIAFLMAIDQDHPTIETPWDDQLNG